MWNLSLPKSVPWVPLCAHLVRFPLSLVYICPHPRARTTAIRVIAVSWGLTHGLYSGGSHKHDYLASQKWWLQHSTPHKHLAPAASPAHSKPFLPQLGLLTCFPKAVSASTPPPPRLAPAIHHPRTDTNTPLLPLRLGLLSCPPQPTMLL